MKFNKEEKLSILTQLIKLAGADGEHRDEEYDLLHRITEQLEVEPIEMELLFNQYAEHKAPAQEIHRITIFFFMLLMVGADGEVDQDEIHLLRELTIKLALPVQAVDRCIDMFDLYPNGNIPAQEIIKVFQIHHN